MEPKTKEIEVYGEIFTIKLFVDENAKSETGLLEWWFHFLDESYIVHGELTIDKARDVDMWSIPLFQEACKLSPVTQAFVRAGKSNQIISIRDLCETFVAEFRPKVRPLVGLQYLKLEAFRTGNTQQESTGTLSSDTPKTIIVQSPVPPTPQIRTRNRRWAIE